MNNKLIGQTIGSYRILGQIGQGGMGAVYLAEHVVIGRKAALKLLLPQFSADEEMVARMFNEARAAALIDHAGLVDIYDFGTHTNGSAYLVMEHLQGESLETLVRREGRLSLELAVALTRQIAGAVGAAHSKGIVHRDLKPDNIFVVADAEVACGFRARVLDFGIAKLSEGKDQRYKTGTDVLMGTPVYMSPEQCRGAGFTDHRTDIYSLGCVLFEMLSGRPPFVKQGQGELIAAHIYEPPPSIATFAPHVPPPLQSLIASMLAKDVTERPQSMAAVVERLRSVAAAPAWEGAAGRRTPARSIADAPPVAPTLVMAAPGGTAAFDSLSPVATENRAERSPRGDGRSARLGRRLILVGSVVAAGVLAATVLWPHFRSASTAADAGLDLEPGGRAASAGAGGGRAGQPIAVVNRRPIDTPAAPAERGVASTGTTPEESADARGTAAPTVTLTIASKPRGATVQLASTGALIGRTPVAHTVPAGPGDVAFVLKRAGYRDEEVILPAARDGRVTVSLRTHATSAGAGGDGGSRKDASGHGVLVLDPFATP